MAEKDSERKKLWIKCGEAMSKAENVLECPVCFHVTKDMVQCVTGHHCCKNCQKQLDVCPLCRNEFIGTRSFLLEHITEAMGTIKQSLSDLEEIEKKPVENGIETVKGLLKAVLFDFSAYCHKNNNFLVSLSKYLQDPTRNNNKASNDNLENQLIGLTSDLRKLTLLLNNTEETLNSLKTNTCN